MKATIRWMQRRDFQDVVKLDAECIADKFARWTEDEFAEEIRSANTVGMVVEVGGRVVAYYVYMVQKHTLHILRLVVERDYRDAVGKAILTKLKEKLSPVGDRTNLLYKVRERDIWTQLLLKKECFLCFKTIRGYFEDTAEDAYLFKYTSTKENDIISTFAENEGKP